MSNPQYRILAIDDTPANLEVLSEILTHQGYSVATAISGERAIKRLENNLPDLILLDVQMPGMNGFDTCQQIKNNSRTASIPIIFITALSDSESIAKGLSLGAVDYIGKPFQEAELIARVKTHLQLWTINQTLEQQVAERTRALESAMAQLKASQLQIVQSEKMATLGNLVAGVAHEINNPVGFLNGSIHNAQDYMKDLLAYLDTYRQQQPPTKVVQASADRIDLDFLIMDLPKLLDSMRGATDRIKDISTSLRTFSRADTEHTVRANLHEGLDSALLILKYRLKANEHRSAINVIKEYGDIPDIYCFPGQLNQVFMNILANAIDMFDEMVQQSSLSENAPQEITITTVYQAEEKLLEICIADNGKGMSEAVKAKIFDHLFTTKDVGKGTGLGLAIAHQIVTKTHQGRLEVQSKLGQGSQFMIALPILE
ncbi:MAG: response regulator [Cyanobacteria bacterium P01_H01_bin.152]